LAHNAVVINYGENYGYKGLYTGKTAGQIKSRKGLDSKQNILDHMGATELAANYFRITQTEEQKSFFIYAWRFILLTGLRRAELCNLKNEDSKEDKIIHVRGTKTDAADRYIALSPRMRKVLSAQRKMLKEAGIISPYVFPDERGDYLDPAHLYKKWYIYRKQHGIKSSLHELRHTLISVSKSDVPEELLKLTVGHTAKTDTFGIYGHTVNGDLERAANLIDNVFTRILE